MNVLNDSKEFHSNENKVNSSNEIQSNPNSEPISNLSFSNHQGENLNNNLKVNFNNLSKENEQNSFQDKNKDNNEIDNESNINDFARIENDNSDYENRTENCIAKECYSEKSSDFHLLNENIMNDEDEIKNEIQAIDNTFFYKNNESNQNHTEKNKCVLNQDKNNQMDIDNNQLDVAQEKRRLEDNSPLNGNLINDEDAKNNKNFSQSNTILNLNNDNQQIHEDRNCKKN